MSQFDFPRINFHGSAKLDTPTANNGNYEPNLILFDQNESEAFLPPLVFNGTTSIPITPINADNYQAWATTPLGSFGADSDYYQYYANTTPPLTGSCPGYWNFYGDLSMTTQDVLVTGVTIPDPTAGAKTFTPQSSGGCPPALAQMLGAELSFNSNYFDPQSRTTAYLCDVDSIGQMCTQIFAGQVGLYSAASGQQTTFFSGTPCKSTARWMNLNKVLNYAGMVPMG